MNKNKIWRQGMDTRINTWALGLTLALAAGTAWAQTSTHTPTQAHGDHAHHGASTPAVSASAGGDAAAQVMTDGEVRRWDASTGKLTLRHAPIANLNMPAMTMVFVLQDKAAGDALSVGQRVRFHAERANGALSITRIEAVR